jgi:LysR family transcriptional regulator, glycine cleavage system transcriptional activator
MKRGRLPLTALRSFEVAGRLQSFTQAAQELLISQAAVSRQVRELETMLGRMLFERGHRSVHLTPAGQDLLAVLTPSFDAIADRLDSLSGDTDIFTVRISSEPSFAACWLVPHLAEFRQQHPQIDVDVDVDTRLVEFRKREALVGIRHGRTARVWPRVESRHLADVKVAPFMAPALVETSGLPTEPRDLLRHALLHEERRETWLEWFEAAGVSAPHAERGPVYADEGLTLQAALRGQGVALLDERMAEEDFRAGRLVRPFDLSIPYGAYFIVARRFDSLPPPAAIFVAWLEDRFVKAEEHG